MLNTTYLITGRNVKFSGLIGSCLKEMGCSLFGRELVGDFMQLTFSEQLNTIKNDLTKHFWHSDVKIVAQSYGGYLLMHALYEIGDCFPGRILLLSPILGTSKTNTNKIVVRPPRADKLKQYAINASLPFLNIEVHTGKEDNGCDPELAEMIFSSIPTSSLNIVENMGHSLEPSYIKNALKIFITKNKDYKLRD